MAHRHCDTRRISGVDSVEIDADTDLVANFQQRSPTAKQRLPQAELANSAHRIALHPQVVEQPLLDRLVTVYAREGDLLRLHAGLALPEPF